MYTHTTENKGNKAYNGKQRKIKKIGIHFTDKKDINFKSLDNAKSF